MQCVYSVINAVYTKLLQSDYRTFICLVLGHRLKVRYQSSSHVHQAINHQSSMCVDEHSLSTTSTKHTGDLYIAAHLKTNTHYHYYKLTSLKVPHYHL